MGCRYEKNSTAYIACSDCKRNPQLADRFEYPKGKRMIPMPADVECKITMPSDETLEECAKLIKDAWQIKTADGQQNDV